MVGVPCPPVDQPPVHIAVRGHLVHHRHGVLPLDAGTGLGAGVFTMALAVVTVPMLPVLRHARHLTDERERLVGRPVEIRLEPLPLRRQYLAVPKRTELPRTTPRKAARSPVP